MSSHLRPKWQKIRNRKWSDVCEGWLNHIPLIDPAGSRPEPGLESYSPFVTSLPSIVEYEPQPDIEGIRKQIFWESLFLYHRGAHVMRAAQFHAKRGMVSWSLFSAYHSAYVTAKAIVGFLGVSLPRISGQQTLIDIFPSVKKKKKPGKSLQVGEEEYFVFLKLPGQLDQRYLWELLQRMLNITGFEKSNIQVLGEAILELDWEEISRRRNLYIYSNVFWPPFDDLFTNVVNDDFFLPEKDKNNEWSFTEDNQTFLMELAFILFELCTLLIGDLTQLAPVLKKQVEYQARIDWQEDNALFDCYRKNLEDILSVHPS